MEADGSSVEVREMEATKGSGGKGSVVSNVD